MNWISSYLQAHIVFTVTTLLICLARYLPINHGSRLRLSYQMIIMAFVSVVLLPAIEGFDFPHWTTPVPRPVEPYRMWSAPADLPQTNIALAAPVDRSENLFHWGWPLVHWVVLMIATGGLFWGMVIIIRSRMTIRKITRQSHRLKHLANTEVWIYPQIQIPFTSWIPSKKQIFIPQSALLETEKLRLARRHEFQHHRQGDCRGVYLLVAIQALLWVNPFIRILIKQLHELQEFACDEALLGQDRVSAQSYGRYLLEVAQQARHPLAPPACATGMARGTDGNLLKRRIQSMLKTPSQVLGAGTTTLISALFMISIVGTGWSSTNTIRDQRISLVEAQTLAQPLIEQSDFPIVVNSRVLRYLNYYLATPRGLQYTRDALREMKPHRPGIEEIIERYQYPKEFLAIPFVESGFRNLPPHKNKYRAAGLWQFIPGTARNYGLQVDKDLDQRLNISLETDAAMRLLGANYLRFGDWALSAMAYNVGSGRVQNGIDKTGLRDPWKMIEAGYANGENYLAKITAAMIILRHPHLAQ